MISKEEVKHVAKLARLELGEKETEKYRKELSLILEYIEELNKADVSRTEPTSHSLDLKNVMRDDEGGADYKIAKKLIDAAPETKDGFIKVKPVFK